MDEENRDLNQWIVNLVRARDRFIDFFVNGRAVGGLNISKGNRIVKKKFEKVVSQCWKLEKKETVGCVFVNSINDGDNHLIVNFDLTAMGFSQGAQVYAERKDYNGGESGIEVDNDATMEIEIGIEVERDTPTMVVITKMQ